MQRTKWLLAAVCVVALTSNSACAADTETTVMKQIVVNLFEITWNKADFTGLSDVWNENTIFHFRGSSSNVGAEGLKAVVTHWRSGFPDLTFTVHQIIAEGDTVAARVNFAGTHTGNYGDLQPTQ